MDIYIIFSILNRYYFPSQFSLSPHIRRQVRSIFHYIGALFSYTQIWFIPTEIHVVLSWFNGIHIDGIYGILYKISNSLGRSSIHSIGNHIYTVFNITLIILSYTNMYFYDKFEHTPERTPPKDVYAICIYIHYRVYSTRLSLCVYIIYYNTLVNSKPLYTCRYINYT